MSSPFCSPFAVHLGCLLIPVTVGQQNVPTHSPVTTMPWLLFEIFSVRQTPQTHAHMYDNSYKESQI